MAQPSGIMRIATFNIVPKGEPMAQLNITLNQDEILQLLSADDSVNLLSDLMG
jgi:hypothetical protein